MIQNKPILNAASLNNELTNEILKFDRNTHVIYMKGVSYITDEKRRRKAVVIDLKTLEQYDEQIEDLFDAIIAESRRDETSSDWGEVKKRLKKKGKL